MAAIRDRHVVVLGGSSGIGYATAQACIEAGARVTVASRDSGRVAAAARTLGGGAAGRELDATDRAAIADVFASLGGGVGLFRDLEPEALRKAIEGKLWANVNAIQAVLPHLARDGSITVVSGAAARVAQAATSGLAASNGALNAMVPTLAVELSPIRVNAVCPGFIATTMFENWPEDLRQRFAERSSAIPVGRAGRAEEVARVILLLLQNDFMTGTLIDVDGGLHLKP